MLTSYNKNRDWVFTLTLGYDGSWHNRAQPVTPPEDELYAIYDSYFDAATGVSMLTTWRNQGGGTTGLITTELTQQWHPYFDHVIALRQAANGGLDGATTVEIDGRSTWQVDVDSLYRRMHYGECYSDCLPLGEFPEQTTITVDAASGALLVGPQDPHPAGTPSHEPVESINEFPAEPSPVRDRMLQVILDLDTSDFGKDPNFVHMSLGPSVLIPPGQRLSARHCTLSVDPPQGYIHIATRAIPGTQSAFMEDSWASSFSLDWPLSDIQHSLWQSGVRQLLLVAATTGDQPMTYAGIEVERTVTSSGPLQTAFGELEVNDLGIVEVFTARGPSPGIRVETTIPGPDGDRFVALGGDLSIAELRDVLATIHEVC